MATSKHMSGTGNLNQSEVLYKMNWPLLIQNMPSEPPAGILAGIVPGHHLLKND